MSSASGRRRTRLRLISRTSGRPRDCRPTCTRDRPGKGGSNRNGRNRHPHPSPRQPQRRPGPPSPRHLRLSRSRPRGLLPLRPNPLQLRRRHHRARKGSHATAKTPTAQPLPRSRLNRLPPTPQRGRPPTGRLRRPDSRNPPFPAIPRTNQATAPSRTDPSDQAVSRRLSPAGRAGFVGIRSRSTGRFRAPSRPRSESR